ncbi:MAG: threonine--tRNA ligase [Candidatus Promineifilaceae bacterium]
MSINENPAKEHIQYKDSDLFRIRHSAAHVMAQAVLELYPQTSLAIGPPVENGFYYDFDLGKDEQGRPLTFRPEDLARIETRMRGTIKGSHPFHYREISPDEAGSLFADQSYKLELIDGLVSGNLDENGNKVDAGLNLSTYQHDTFEDLCRGPHVKHTGQIPPDGFKLMNVAGAYWRGDEHNPMLQRIYGTAWHNKEDLDSYLEMLEEAKKRDHRKLGRELELFIFDEEIGPGLALWLPRGEIIVEEMEKLAREMEDRAGYVRVRTPHIAKEALYLRSGHLPYYADDMYAPMEREGSRYYLKPMNCPFHHKIYASKLRSYRDLPLRLAEHGMVYRYEQSGELFGLMRVRGNQQNDAHIYCSEEQFEDEFMAVIGLYQEYFRLFGIERYMMRLSKHSADGLGKKYKNNPRLWLKTEEMVRQAMINGGVPFYEAEDEAAFYGPKIDAQVWSAIGREFSLATNQVDFAQPPRFDLSFTNRDSADEVPLYIHRAPLGSHERTIGFLIEHYAGNFPVWLSPEQVRIIPITDAHHEYAVGLEDQLKDEGIRAQADLGSGRMGAKIRAAQLMKVPYMLVIGDREMAEQTVSVRFRDGRRQNDTPRVTFVAEVKERIASRSASL